MFSCNKNCLGKQEPDQSKLLALRKQAHLGRDLFKHTGGDNRDETEFVGEGSSLCVRLGLCLTPEPDLLQGGKSCPLKAGFILCLLMLAMTPLRGVTVEGRGGRPRSACMLPGLSTPVTLK